MKKSVNGINKQYKPHKLFLVLFLIIIVWSWPIIPSLGKKNQKGKNDNDMVTMDFEKVDLQLVIKFISELTGKNFIIDDAVKGNVTIISPTAIPKDEAYRVFESILEVKGFAAIPSGDAIKIVPARQAPERNIKMRTKTDLADEKQDDSVVTQLIPVEYASVSNIVKVIQPLISKQSKLITYEPTNTIIIIDTISNINRLLEIIKQIDVESTDVTYRIIALEHALPNIITKEAQAIINQMRATKSTKASKRKKRGGSSSSSEPKIIPDSRTGSVIVVADEDDMEDIINLINKLDAAAPKSQGNIQVYFLKNSKAEDIAATLTKIASQKGSTKGKTPAEVTPLIQNTSIVADKSTNSLIIIASPLDYKILKNIIEQLDIMRPQVLVEALIAEVSYEKMRELGVEWRGMDLNTDSDSYKGFGGTNFGKISAAQNYQVPDGMFLGVFKGAIDLGPLEVPNIAALIQAYQTDSDINILSTPHILTIDNEEAQILVGEDVPIRQTETVENRTYNNTVYKSVGMGLQITPHINPDGYIKLELSLKIDTVKEVDEKGPWTYKREAKTTVMVKDKQTIIIGGLIQDNKQQGFGRVPCLGEIPLIGWLFRSMRKKNNKANLQVFITPHIIRTPEELNILTNKMGTSLKKDNLKQNVIDPNQKILKNDADGK